MREFCTSTIFLALSFLCTTANVLQLRHTNRDELFIFPEQVVGDDRKLIDDRTNLRIDDIENTEIIEEKRLVYLSLNELVNATESVSEYVAEKNQLPPPPPPPKPKPPEKPSIESSMEMIEILRNIMYMSFAFSPFFVLFFAL